MIFYGPIFLFILFRISYSLNVHLISVVRWDYYLTICVFQKKCSYLSVINFQKNYYLVNILAIILLFFVEVQLRHLLPTRKNIVLREIFPVDAASIRSLTLSLL